MASDQPFKLPPESKVHNNNFQKKLLSAEDRIINQLAHQLVIFWNNYTLFVASSYHKLLLGFFILL